MHFKLVPGSLSGIHRSRWPHYESISTSSYEQQQQTKHPKAKKSGEMGGDPLLQHYCGRGHGYFAHIQV